MVTNIIAIKEIVTIYLVLYESPIFRHGCKRHDHGDLRDHCTVCKRHDETETSVIMALATVPKYRRLIKNKAKIVVERNGRAVMLQRIQKPCQHLLLREIICKLVQTTPDCIASSAHHKIIVDMDRMSQMYYGGIFFYGNYTVYSLFLSDNCNFSCVSGNLIFLPK
ncbi:hypothetical protein evm_006164 [Chilo suppressalis]|nr:hypothetical protein evm_006164 [Chilo suppressalis]